MSLMIEYITKTYYFPTLSIHLNTKFGLSVESSSLYFIIDLFSYFFFFLFIDKITKRIGRKATMLMGHFLNIIWVLLVSPLDVFPQ